MSEEKFKKLSSARYSNRNGAENNRVFLLEWNEHLGRIAPVEGWKIVGWITPPYPRYDSMTREPLPGIVLERTDEEVYRYKDFTEGTQIWQHWLGGKERYYIFEEPKTRKKK